MQFFSLFKKKYTYQYRDKKKSLVSQTNVLITHKNVLFKISRILISGHNKNIKESAAGQVFI